LITVSRQAAGKRAGACVVWDLETQKRLAELSDITPSSTPKAPMGLLSPDGLGW